MCNLYNGDLLLNHAGNIITDRKGCTAVYFLNSHNVESWIMCNHTAKSKYWIVWCQLHIYVMHIYKTLLTFLSLCVCFFLQVTVWNRRYRVMVSKDYIEDWAHCCMDLYPNLQSGTWNNDRKKQKKNNEIILKYFPQIPVKFVLSKLTHVEIKGSSY